MSEIAGTTELRAVEGGRRFSVVIGVCCIIVGVVVVMAAFGSLIAPQDPVEQDLSSILVHPSGAHWLGTDALGRDVFSRMIVGARLGFVGPLVVAVGSMLLGTILGLLAGYRGGRIDAVIMRWVDLMWAIPGLLLIIVVAGTLGGGYWLAVSLLTVLYIPFQTRVVRGAALEQVPRPYVEAAKVLGVSDKKIMFRHVLPNVSAIVVSNMFLIFAGALVGLAGLSFLGLGAAPGTPDWGLMLAEARNLLFVNPVAALAPGVIIVITAIAMTLIGDSSYEHISSRGATR